MKILEVKRVDPFVIVKFDNNKEIIIPYNQACISIEQAINLAGEIAIQMQKLCKVLGIPENRYVTLKEILGYCEWLAKNKEEI